MIIYGAWLLMQSLQTKPQKDLNIKNFYDLY